MVSYKMLSKHFNKYSQKPVRYQKKCTAQLTFPPEANTPFALSINAPLLTISRNKQMLNKTPILFVYFKFQQNFLLVIIILLFLCNDQLPIISILTVSLRKKEPPLFCFHA